jgi:hypothetical protein
MFSCCKDVRISALIAALVLIHSGAIAQRPPTGTNAQAVPRLRVRSQLFTEVPRFELGVHVGPGLGWLRGYNVVDDMDPLLGAAAGINLQYNLSSLLGVRLGAGYQQKGSNMEVEFTDVNGSSIGSGSMRVALDYFRFPLMVCLGFGQRVRISAGVGGYVGMLMSAQQITKGFDIPQVTITDNFEPLDLGITTSMLVDLPLSERFALNTEVRYDKGLSNISALPVVNDGSIHTNAASLLVGCTYRFGGAL